MTTTFEYIFPAIRGVQAGREYFVSMCPMRLIPRLFLYNEEELVPEFRAQRTLNKARLPEMSRYVLDNPKSYCFSAITASIDAEVKFEPNGASSEGQKMGALRVPMSAKFIINDGQHRRAAIEMALRDRPELGDESIAVVFFLDVGLERCQQMFADLNRYAVRPSRSIGILYDHRDKLANLAKLTALRSEAFHDLVDMERGTLSPRSRKLFTLSSLYTAIEALARGQEHLEEDILLAACAEYWQTVDKQFDEWKLVRERKITAGDVRRDFLNSHGIVLHALGIAGNLVMWRDGNWRRQLGKLKQVDWSRSNATLWEGRALVAGRVSKASNNQTLTTNAIKHQLGLPLTPEEQRVEDAFVRGKNGRRR